MLRNITILVFILLASFAISPAYAIHESLANHPARSPEKYPDFSQKALWERMTPAPDFLVDYLVRDNQVYGYPEVPKAAQCDKELLADFQMAIKELPESVKNQVKDHLVGIFTVKDLGTTGYCEVLDDFETKKLGIIVIDINFIDKKANEWASWRANSPFKSDGKTQARAIIETPENNTRKQAIQYIIKYEIGHLVGAVNKVHPDWNNGGNPADFSFSKMSWVESGGKVYSKFESLFPLRSDLRFYSFDNSSVSSDQILTAYNQLEKTSFTTLYGATNMWADFAEAYALYIHTVLQQKPWSVELQYNGETVRTYLPSLMTDQGKMKNDLLESLFR